MKKELDIIKKNATVAKQSYKRIDNAWLCTKDVGSRIDSLLILAEELKRTEQTYLNR